MPSRRPIPQGIVSPISISQFREELFGPLPAGFNPDSLASSVRSNPLIALLDFLESRGFDSTDKMTPECLDFVVSSVDEMTKSLRYTERTTASYLKAFRMLCYTAVRRGYLARSPFLDRPELEKWIKTTLIWSEPSPKRRTAKSSAKKRREARNAQILKEIEKGESLREVAEVFGMSPANVHRVAKLERQKAAVIIGSRNEPPIVLNEPKPILTTGQYDVVRALLNAGRDGLSKSELGEFSGHPTTALKILRNLKNSDPGWAKVIIFPQARQRGGYRISAPPEDGT